MAARGIDTQMLATKPTDFSANQSRINKQNENITAQNAAVINRDTERDSERTVAATSAEDKKIGTEERERGGNSRSKREKEKEKEEQTQKEWVDPMLSLPVEKGKYAKPKKHYINIEV